MFCLFISAIHTVAHIVNVEYLIDNWKSSDLIEQRLFKLSDTENTTYMNPFRERDVVRLLSLIPLVYL